MTTLRALLARHRSLALWLGLASLAIRALVPTGYMVTAQSTVLTVAICADTTDQHLTRQIRLSDRDGPAAPQRGEHPPACPFSGLSAMAVGAAAPALVVAALAFALALVFAALPLPMPRRTAHLRPPLRGPPILA